MGKPLYKPEFAEQAENLASHWYTDADMAKFFGVSTKNFIVWKDKYPELGEAIKKGKHAADTRVERALYERATGYNVPEEKVFCNAAGQVTRVETTKHFPPETAAMIFWLKNRKRLEWRDRQDLELAGKDGGAVPIQIQVCLKEKG